MIKQSYMQVYSARKYIRVESLLYLTEYIPLIPLFLCPDCCRGRVLSVAWACRKEAKEFSNCMSKYTSRIGAMKALWVARGSKNNMSETEWDLLLDDVTASE